MPRLAVQQSLLRRTLPLSFSFFFIPRAFACALPTLTHTLDSTLDRHSQAVNGAPAWCGDCAGQCAPLCDCMPPRLRLSLDTSQPSRPADLYPTVTLSERHRETEGEGANERARERGDERGNRERRWGGRGERMQKSEKLP